MYYIYLLLTLIIDSGITVKFDMVKSFADLWKPLLMFPPIYAFFIGVHVLLLMFVSMFAKKDRKLECMDNFFRWFSIQTLDIVVKTVRLNIHIKGKELIPENERFLMIGNHRSVLDPMIAMRVFEDKQVAFVSKKENMKIPFIGRLMNASGCISLDRENNRDAVKSIKKASEYISNGLASMGIYPEGRINKTDDVLLPFHSGSFKIAMKSKAPIVITTMTNTRGVFKRFLFRRTNVDLNILGVIRPEQYASMKTNEISDMVYEIMSENLREYKTA